MLTGDVGIIIPAYNEEKRLTRTLKTLRGLSPMMDVLVVDDGSTDKTGKIALEQGANLLTLEKNYGKGYALKRGISYLGNPIIVFMDADIGDTAKEVIKLINPLLQDRAEVTIGNVAFTPGKGGFGLVKGLSQIAFKHLTGEKCPSVLSGQRAFKREVLSEELLNYRGYGIEFGMTVDLAWKGLRILEIPVEIDHRVTGRDFKGFKHRGRQFWDIMGVLIKKKIEALYLRGTSP